MDRFGDVRTRSRIEWAKGYLAFTAIIDGYSRRLRSYCRGRR
jgi:hypothetical protein